MCWVVPLSSNQILQDCLGNNLVYLVELSSSGKGSGGLWDSFCAEDSPSNF